MLPDVRRGAFLLVLLGGRAAANPAPGLTLPGHTLELVVTTEVNASKNAFGEPTSVAPDVAFGVTPDLTLSVVHSTFGTTGFRGSAGRGLCVTGQDHGCANVYDGGGVEALYGVRRGAFAVAANAGVHALGIDAEHYAGKLGAKLRYTIGRVVLSSLPSVFVAFTERDTNLDRIFLPVTAAYKVTPAFSLGIATGIKGPFDGFADRYEVAAGASAQYTVAPAITVAASYAHGKLFAGDDALAEGVRGRDLRAVHLWLAWRTELWP